MRNQSKLTVKSIITRSRRESRARKTLLSDQEKIDIREIRTKLVDKSDDLHDKLMKVGVL